MAIFKGIRTFYQFGYYGHRYLSEARHLSFDEAHARRAFWSNQLLASLGVTYDVRDDERLVLGRPCIYVANHSSLMDALVLCGIFDRDVRFLAKKELFHAPLLKTALVLERHIPVSRGTKDNSHLEKLKQAVAAAVSEGGSCVFFPEGTRTPDGNLGKFKLGAFFNAVQNNVPIVPIALEGFFKINPKTSNYVKPGHAVVHALPAIEVPEDESERERAQKMCDLARTAILKKLVEIGQQADECKD